jgi:hypothetical protein
MPPKATSAKDIVFFVDRCFGRQKVVEALKAAGHQAIPHDALFKQNAKDHEWLPKVAKLGYVILSFDEHLRTNALERQAIKNSKASVFVFVSKNLIGDEMALAFVKAAGAMRRFAVKHKHQPFIAKVYSSGSIAPWKWDQHL